MRISLVPADSKDTASSRIRVFTLQGALAALGVDASFEYSPTADVVFVQKRVDQEMLFKLERAKSEGRAVIYDVDDLGPPLRYFIARRILFRVLDLADVVTTDTAGHGDLLRTRFGVRHVELLPDTIDYFPAGPAIPKLRNGAPLRVLWFGAVGNIRLFERYLLALTTQQDLEAVVMTNADAIETLRGRYPTVTFVPWSRAGFVESLQACDLTCLTHDGSTTERAKSNNKMITSITWGVPALVSATPEYARTAQEASVPEAVFANERELVAALAHYRNEERRRVYLESAQPAIWERYRPELIAQRFLEIVEIALLRAGERASVRPLRQGFATRTRFAVWLLRSEESRIELARDVAKRALRRLKKRDHQGQSEAAAPGQAVRDYLRDWVSPEGRGYRMKTYRRQKRDGTKPLLSNPSVDEVKAVLREIGATSVLEVGCGWGRLLEELAEEFNVEGCDVSEDMLRLCPPRLRTFRLDIASENLSFGRANLERWDVLFTRGVMLYFAGRPLQMAYAMNTMAMLARHAVIIWEWPEVCDEMRGFSDGPKFRYMPIEHRSE